jgi:predicted small secreted protein
MDRTSALVLATFVVAALFFASASCNAFIGAGIDLAKGFSNTINFDLGKDITIGDTAFALAGMDVAVTWGANYDLAALAGYPYGYGGVGSVTQGGVGYDLGITIDAINGAGFNGANWGAPMAEQGVTTTHYAEGVAQQALIDDTQVALPFA